MENMDTIQWKVLLVDDDLDQRIVISQVLDFYDAKVTVADSGHAALQLLATDSSFNLGLLDIRMPDMSGWELIDEIRKHAETSIREMPLIAVTANVMQGDRERVLSAGFSGYLPKPIEPTTLIQDIRNILENGIVTKPVQPAVLVQEVRAILEIDKENVQKP